MAPRPNVSVIGRWADTETYRLRDFLTRIAQPYSWIEAGTSQADKVGAELPFRTGVTGSRLDGKVDDEATLILQAGTEIKASVVLAAPGMDWRRIDLEGIDELIGHGIYYGAGRSEARGCSSQ